MSVKVAVMAAGTGGHVFPALACAQELRDLGHQVLWVGTPNGMEKKVAQVSGFDFMPLDIQGFRGKSWLHRLRTLGKICKSTWQAYRQFSSSQPDCILGMGGYVTVPGGLAAKLLGIPLVIHEQNSVAGTANRILSRWATYVCMGFPSVFNQPNAEWTGNPIRKAFFTKDMPYHTAARLRLLVLGGSLGAEPLNVLLPETLAKIPLELRPEIQHQTGVKHVELTQKRYQVHQVQATVVDFIEDMSTALAWSDLVVCRAGALTVGELTAVGKGSLLIPLPHAIDDHQSKNAEYLCQQGAACVFKQKELTPDTFSKELMFFLENPEKLNCMAKNAKKLARPNATQAVVSACLKAVHGK